jgi:hypothetical protein
MNRVCLFLLLPFLLLSTGCQLRETNKSLQQADQATEASQKILAEQVAPQVATLSEENKKAVEAALNKICSLLNSARSSIRPALTITAGNEPPPQVDTTVEEAVERTEQFVAKAAMQTGRATVEAEKVSWWLQVTAMALKFGETTASGWMTLLLSGGGTAGLLAAGVLKHISKLRTAVKDAVQFGNDAVAINPEDAEARKHLIEKHKKIQEENGTKNVIKSAGAAVKAPTTPAV